MMTSLLRRHRSGQVDLMEKIDLPEKMTRQNLNLISTNDVMEAGKLFLQSTLQVILMKICFKSPSQFDAKRLYEFWKPGLCGVVSKVMNAKFF